MEAVITKSEMITKSAYELERGKPAPSLKHSIVQSNLIFHFRKKYDDDFRVLSEISIKVAQKERVPDIAIYKKKVKFAGKDEIRMPEAPLCAIEILSPTQSMDTLIAKCASFFEDGVQSYWLVLPGLEAICVFSKADKYSFFGKEDTLIDRQLNVELSLKDIFK